MDSYVDEGVIGVARCGSCDTRGDVYMTEAGLRCEDCEVALDDSERTYVPSLRETNNDGIQNRIDNVSNFTDNLADIGFDVELQDGSVYNMDKFETHAVLMKYGEDWGSFLTSLASKISEYYEKELEPTKFNEYSSWGSSGHDEAKSEYKSHAELAPIVAYHDLRGAIMQLGMMSMTDEDEEPPKVIGINDDFIREYSESGTITFEYEGGDE